MNHIMPPPVIPTHYQVVIMFQYAENKQEAGSAHLPFIPSLINWQWIILTDQHLALFFGLLGLQMEGSEGRWHQLTGSNETASIKETRHASLCSAAWWMRGGGGWLWKGRGRVNPYIILQLQSIPLRWTRFHHLLLHFRADFLLRGHQRAQWWIWSGKC